MSTMFKTRQARLYAFAPGGSQQDRLKNGTYDFIGPISLAARESQARYIITATDYVTKWAEARAVRKANALAMARFLYEDIIT